MRSKGSPAEAIGKQITRGEFTFQVIGVVADIHQVSPKMVMEPLIYMAPGHYNGFVSLLLGGGKPAETMQQAEEIFVSYFPRLPLHTFWLDDHYSAGTDDERRFGPVFALFSGLALLVTLMGIMGVAAYTAQQRQKEIAIRKTFGASTARIFGTLFLNYLVLIFTAAILIFPVAYFWLNNWLVQFASRVSISPLSILLPLVLVTATTLVTVWLQSNRILRVNPADVLKE